MSRCWCYTHSILTSLCVVLPVHHQSIVIFSWFHSFMICFSSPSSFLFKFFSRWLRSLVGRDSFSHILALLQVNERERNDNGFKYPVCRSSVVYFWHLIPRRFHFTLFCFSIGSVFSYLMVILPWIMTENEKLPLFLFIQSFVLI